MDQFKVFRIHAAGDTVTAGFEQTSLEALSAGEVVIRVAWSSINYKDALAATGKGRILRTSPLVGGIDLSGTVESSTDPRYRPGDAVLVTGCGLSETRDGGYAEYARVPGDAVISLPDGLDLRTAMGVGTAGFAAALGIHKMELLGLKPGQGPVVVTGASGGVGSIAIDILAARGHEVVAVSGKAELDRFLHGVGAARILRRQDIDLGTRPLEKALWAGAVDNVGAAMLAWLTRTVDMNGSIASIGLAGGAELNTTVMPFILRGVNIVGVNSAATTREPRVALWRRIATDLRPRHLDRVITREIGFDELPAVFPEFIAGRIHGRTIVRIGA
jgi:NADPH2:quinone reductase